MVTAAVMAITLSSQVVRAQDANGWNWLFGRQDPRLAVTGIAIGVGTDAAYLALRHRVHYGTTNIRPITVLGALTITTIACGAIFPIVGTMVVNRPLTTREVWTGLGDCVVPFIGGWFVEAVFHGQPWYEGTPVRVARVVHYRHHHHHM